MKSFRIQRAMVIALACAAPMLTGGMASVQSSNIDLPRPVREP